MNFKMPLIKGKLIKRYKRFFADIELDNGEIITSHCPNTGSMVAIDTPGLEAWVSPVDPESTRKLRYTWEMVLVDGNYVGVNTNRPNELVEEAILNNSIPELASYTQYKREVKYGDNSRIDFLLGGNGIKPCYLEIKNVHLKRDDHAKFPSSVTSRGSKHMSELINMVQNGFDAMVIYVVQREDCDYFSVAGDIDPNYATMMHKSHESGVKHLCYSCKISPLGVYIEKHTQIIW